MPKTPDRLPDANDGQFTLLGPSRVSADTDALVAPNPADFADTWESSLRTVDADSIVSRRSSPRKRLVQLGLVAIGALAVFSLLRATGLLLPRPAASTTPVSAAVSPHWIGIFSNISYGIVTVDGKHLSGNPPLAFRSQSNEDMVTFSAPPFAAHTCRVRSALDGSLSGEQYADTHCVYGAGNSTPLRINGQTVFVATYLEFDFGLDDLPADFQASALALVQQSVQPVAMTVSVPAGQYYATGRDAQGMIDSQRATSPLTATVTLELPTVPMSLCSKIICSGAAPFAGQDRQIVDNNGQEHLLPPGKYWSVAIPLALRWQYLAADERVVGTEDDGELSSEGALLRLENTGTWDLLPGMFSSSSVQADLRQHLPSDACNWGQYELINAFQEEQAGNPNIVDDTTTENGFIGCRFYIMAADGITVLESVIWRFGVLLAADTKTHQAYPWLPLAPKAEVDAVTIGH